MGRTQQLAADDRINLAGLLTERSLFGFGAANAHRR